MVVIAVIFCFCLTSCETIIDNLVTPTKVQKREWKLNHENPGRRTEEMEYERALDHYFDIKRQQQKEETIKNNQANDLIDKQIQKSIEEVSKIPQE
jgi:hypothetical protein